MAAPTPTVQTAGIGSSTAPSPPSPTTASVEAAKKHLMDNLKPLKDNDLKNWLNGLNASKRRPNFAPKAEVVYAICDMLLDLMGHLKVVNENGQAHTRVNIDNIELDLSIPGAIRARIKLGGNINSGGMNSDGYNEDMKGLLLLVRYLVTENLGNCLPHEVQEYLNEVDAKVRDPTEAHLSAVLNAIKQKKFKGPGYTWEVILNGAEALVDHTITDTLQNPGAFRAMPTKVPRKQDIHHHSNNNINKNNSANSWATLPHGPQSQSQPSTAEQLNKKPSRPFKSIFRKLKPDFKSTESPKNNPPPHHSHPDPPSIRAIILQSSSSSSLDSFGPELPGATPPPYNVRTSPNAEKEEDKPATAKQKKSFFKSVSKTVSGAAKKGGWSKFLRGTSTDANMDSRSKETAVVEARAAAESMRRSPLTNMVDSEVNRPAISKPTRRPPPPPPPVVPVSQASRRIDPHQGSRYPTPAIRMDSLSHASRSRSSRNHTCQNHSGQPPASRSTRNNIFRESRKVGTTVDVIGDPRQVAENHHHHARRPSRGPKERPRKPKVQFNVPDEVAPKRLTVMPLRDGNGLLEWSGRRRRSSVFVRFNSGNRSRRMSATSSIYSRTSRKSQRFGRNVQHKAGGQSQSYARVTRYSPRFSFGFFSGRRRASKYAQRIENESSKKTTSRIEEIRKEKQRQQDADKEVTDNSSVDNALVFHRLSPEEEAKWTEDSPTVQEEQNVAIRPMRINFRYVQAQRAQYPSQCSPVLSRQSSITEEPQGGSTSENNEWQANTTTANKTAAGTSFVIQRRPHPPFRVQPPIQPQVHTHVQPLIRLQSQAQPHPQPKSTPRPDVSPSVVKPSLPPKPTTVTVSQAVEMSNVSQVRRLWVDRTSESVQQTNGYPRSKHSTEDSDKRHEGSAPEYSGGGGSREWEKSSMRRGPRP
ncbi:MAG: hypothetical protein J3Q66DRAFT_407988 [Benniella sp.]|nr:MAG: hypothetical protein J3Q66DRAFT_407988 [Benniella sp.]